MMTNRQFTNETMGKKGLGGKKKEVSVTHLQFICAVSQCTSEVGPQGIHNQLLPQQEFHPSFHH